MGVAEALGAVAGEGAADGRSGDIAVVDSSRSWASRERELQRAITATTTTIATKKTRVERFMTPHVD